MTQNQRRCLAAGIVVLAAAWLFPPWVEGTRRHAAGYNFLFDTLLFDNLERSANRIDFERLFAESVVVSILTVAAFFAFRSSGAATLGASSAVSLASGEKSSSPVLVHEIDGTGKATHRLEIPENATIEQLLDSTDRLGRLPIGDKTRIQEQIFNELKKRCFLRERTVQAPHA